MPQDNLELLSDEELLNLANDLDVEKDDLESLSDDDLIRLAEEEIPEKKLNPVQKYARYQSNLGKGFLRGVAKGFVKEPPESMFPKPEEESTAGGIGEFGGRIASFAPVLRGAGAVTNFASKAVPFLAKPVVKEAATGALAGFVGTPEDRTIGGVLGGTFGLAAKAIGKGYEIYKGLSGKFRKFKEIPQIEKTIETEKRVIEDLRLKEEGIKLSKAKSLGEKNVRGRVKRLTQRTKETSKEQKISEAQKTQALLKDTKDVLDHNVETLHQNLVQSAEKGSIKFKDALPQFFKDNGKGYRASLENIENSLKESGLPLNAGELGSLVKNVLGELDESFIQSGEAREAVETLFKKYSGKLSNEPINLVEVLDDIKSIRNLIPRAVKEGKERFSGNDTAVALLNKRWGDFIEQRTGLEALKALNNSYAPVIDAMKTSNRIFQPYAGEYNVKKGADFLKQFALKKSEGIALETEEKFIKAIEEGSKFAKGTGQIADDIVGVARKLKEARDRIKPTLDLIKNESALKQSGADKRLASRLKQLSNRQDFIGKSYIEKESAVKDEIAQHLKSLRMNEDAIREVLSDRNKMYSILKTLGFAAAGLTAMGTGGHLIKSAIGLQQIASE